MKRAVTLLFSCSLLSAQSPPKVTAIRCGRLIDGKSAAARANAVIVIEGERIKEVGLGGAGGGGGDRSQPVDRAAGADRQPHAHPAQRRHHRRRLRRATAQGIDSLPRHPRHGERAHGADARLHRHARSGNRRRDVRRRGRQDRHQPRRHPRAAHVRGDTVVRTHRLLSAARLLVGAQNAEGRAGGGWRR